jgi:putative mycofactocin binding protein MftB
MSVVLESVLEIHPQVAVRPETFGALAYHYGNRRLIFLKHPDVVTVVQALNDHFECLRSHSRSLAIIHCSIVIARNFGGCA